MSEEGGVTPFEVVHDTTLEQVTLVTGKGALGTWRSQNGQRRMSEAAGAGVCVRCGGEQLAAGGGQGSRVATQLGCGG